MRINLIGELEHASVCQLRLYTVTDNHASGSNHIVEIAHFVINEEALNGNLLRKCFLQLYRYSRENKIRYVMAFMECLDHWSVLDELEFGFLTVGHTHSDIDHTFSTTSCRLKTHDAITLADTHHEMSQCFNELTEVICMDRCNNWSGRCHISKFLHSVNNINAYRFFIFTSESTIHGVKCYVRGTVDDQWLHLQAKRNDGCSHILSKLRNLKTTPPEILMCPSDLDDVR